MRYSLLLCSVLLCSLLGGVLFQQQTALRQKKALAAWQCCHPNRWGFPDCKAREKAVGTEYHTNNVPACSACKMKAALLGEP